MLPAEERVEIGEMKVLKTFRVTVPFFKSHICIRTNCQASRVSFSNINLSNNFISVFITNPKSALHYGKPRVQLTVGISCL